MSRMKDLFGDEPVGDAFARHSDPHTSHAAAESIKPKVTQLESFVSETIAGSGGRGMICDEIVRITGLNWNTVSPRLRPLCKKNIISPIMDIKTGKPLTRPGHSGRGQIVWVVRP